MSGGKCCGQVQSAVPAMLGSVQGKEEARGRKGRVVLLALALPRSPLGLAGVVQPRTLLLGVPRHPTLCWMLSTSCQACHG